MSRIPSKDLFELIKAMEQTEKRYFKIFTSRHIIKEKNDTNDVEKNGIDNPVQSINKYVMLFNAIDKQKEYNEKRLAADKKFKQLTLLKNRLYEIILKSLDAYHGNDGEDTLLKRQIHYASLLEKKKLYGQCKKIISKALHKAIKYENHIAQIELLKWKIKIIRLQDFRNQTENEVNDIYNMMFQINDKFKNVLMYEHLHTKFVMKRIKKGHPRYADDSLKKEYDTINRNPLLKSEKTALSFDAQYYFHRFHTSAAFMKRDFQSAYHHTQKIISLLENNPHQIINAPIRYANALYDLIISMLDMKKYKEVIPVVNKIKTIPEKYRVKSKDIRHQMFYNADMMQLALYNETGEFEKGIKTVKNLLDYADVLSNSYKIHLYYTIAYTYFGVQDFKTANTYINKILNDLATSIRDDIRCFAKILSLLIHYELGNSDLLEYSVLSTYRFLQKRKRLYKLETIVLDFIRKKLPKINAGNSEHKELIIAFKELKEAIEKVIKNPYEHKVLDYFDFISWLESKIEKRPFADIIKEKVSLQNLNKKTG